MQTREHDKQNTYFDDSSTSYKQSSITATLSDNTETNRAHSDLRHAQRRTT